MARNPRTAATVAGPHQTLSASAGPDFVAEVLGGKLLRLFRAELGVPADRRGAAA